MAGGPLSSKPNESKPSLPRSPLDETEDALRVATLKLAGIEAISRSLISEKTVEEILEAVMARTTDLLEAERATLYLLDDTKGRMWSKITQGDGVRTIDLAVGEGLAGWVAKHGRNINVKDAYKDPRFKADVDLRSDFRTKSVLCHPLMNSRQQIIGVIQVLNKRTGYFTPADEDLLGAIASQAAIGIQNSTLYSGIVSKNIALLEAQLKLKERRSELELLFRIERAAATATSRESALTSVLEAAAEEFPSEVVCLVLSAPHTGQLQCTVAHGSESQRLDGLVFEDDQSLVRSVMATGEHVSLAAVQSEVLGSSVHASHPDWNIRTMAGVPVAHRGERLGVLALINRLDDPRGFDDRDLRILNVIASRMALSLVLARVMEERLKQDRLSAIGQMLSGIVHDLKTPLTVINGYAQLMAGDRPASSREEYKGRIQKQISEIRDMTTELLAFARGESEILLRKTQIRPFLEEVVELLSDEFEQGGMALILDDKYGGGVRMDEGKMRRVIANLARNSLEACGKGSTFTIHVAAKESCVEFRFADDGPGIPEEMTGRLFESFATHGKEHGTGLGLAIVKKFVDEHEGTIRVESAPDKGTSFIVDLPA
jgi:signal transduction histidine kinase/putative methionine-R-sulfoxide reductase with GAF domain